MYHSLCVKPLPSIVFVASILNRSKQFELSQISAFNTAWSTVVYVCIHSLKVRMYGHIIHFSHQAMLEHKKVCAIREKTKLRNTFAQNLWDWNKSRGEHCYTTHVCLVFLTVKFSPAADLKPHLMLQDGPKISLFEYSELTYFSVFKSPYVQHPNVRVIRSVLDHTVDNTTVSVSTAFLPRIHRGFVFSDVFCISYRGVTVSSLV
jgi:hypothetical protein